MSKKLNLKMLLSVIMLICCLSMIVLTGCANEDGQNNNQTQNQPTTETITSESAFNTIRTTLLQEGETETDIAKYFGKYELQTTEEYTDAYGSKTSESSMQYVDYTNGVYNKYLAYNVHTYYYFNGNVTYRLAALDQPTGVVENNHGILRGSPWFDIFLTQDMYDNGGFEENAVRTNSENGFSLTLNLTDRGFVYTYCIIEEVYLDGTTFEEYYQEFLSADAYAQPCKLTFDFENNEVVSMEVEVSGDETPTYEDAEHLTSFVKLTLKISKYEGEIETPQWVSDYISSQETEQIA